jgi:hypothetical protein
MTLKVGKVLTNALIIGLLTAILVMLVRGQKKSMYEPAPLVTQAGPTVRKQKGDLFSIQPSLECTPGPSEKAAYLTSGMTPGGLCGDQEFVRNQIRDYAIADGIGGSLLEK